MSGEKSRSKGISKNVQKMSISAIKEMAILAMNTLDAISLSWGLPSFRTPKHIIDAAIKALQNDCKAGKYAPTQGFPELRQAIAERVSKDRSWQVNPENQIIVTAGAMEGITLAWHALVDPGDEVVITDPGFSSHYEQATLVGAKIVPWRLIENEGWRLDIDSLESLITHKTKVLILCTPNNPTGTVFLKKDLDRVAELAVKHDFYIIADEPYDFLVYDGREFYSPAHNESIRDRLVLSRSLSKEYAMSGWRAGYVVAEAGLTRQMLKVHDSTVICAPTISQIAATAALTGPQDCVKEFQKELAERRELFCSLMDEQSDLFEYVKPEGSYYVFPRIKIPGIDSYKFALDLLDKAKVVVVPGDAFGELGAEHVRMTFCGSREEIKEGFKRIGEFKQNI